MKKLLSKTGIILLTILIVASFLRFYKLSVDPPSLFGDEVDVGYQAYSILKTGRDYYGDFMPIHLHSLAEWRTSLYLYSAVPTVAVWGITPLGVRTPAAIFGILGILVFYLLIKELKVNRSFEIGRWKFDVAEIGAFLLAISPWHLQYSRAGYEATQMLFFLILGLWLFFKSINNKNGKYLWVSVLSFCLTPWVYSTAKFFTPFFLTFLFFLYFKKIFSFSRKHLIYAAAAGLIVGVPIVYSTIYGGGEQRFNYISVFADPTTNSNIGTARELDARIRGETGAGLTPKSIDRVVYNKFTYWGDNILKNYLSIFSTNFLFVKGDHNYRQSIGMGELYRIEIVALIFGIIYFFTNKDIGKKTKIFTVFWLLFAPVPSALTVDGGDHATRTILLLPPLILLVAYGWLSFVDIFKAKYKLIILSGIALLYAVSMFFYFHEYYVVYPVASANLWHYGWTPAIKEIKSIDANYNKVFISMSKEPAWIFFAANYEYPPSQWQKNFPIGNDVTVDGFGKISHIGKFYFGSPTNDVQIYGLGRYIDSKTLYLANASEDGDNLIMDPIKVPPGLKLIKAIAYPNGEPAFYLFSGTSD